jgi:hypothetical protein
MAKKVLSHESFAAEEMQPIFHYRWIFDPVPYWFKNLSKEQWIRFNEMEIELRKKEIEIDEERIRGLKNL